MPHVAMCVETHQICSQQAVEQLRPLRQCSKQFVGRKRNVVKIANTGIGSFVTDHFGKQHQLVVLHPNNVARVDDFERGFAEKLVHLFVGLPVLGFVTDIAGKVV
jgi:hypothetical protein